MSLGLRKQYKAAGHEVRLVHGYAPRTPSCFDLRMSAGQRWQNRSTSSSRLCSQVLLKNNKFPRGSPCGVAASKTKRVLLLLWAKPYICIVILWRTPPAKTTSTLTTSDVRLCTFGSLPWSVRDRNITFFTVKVVECWFCCFRLRRWSAGDVRSDRVFRIHRKSRLWMCSYEYVGVRLDCVRRVRDTARFDCFRRVRQGLIRSLVRHYNCYSYLCGQQKVGVPLIRIAVHSASIHTVSERVWLRLRFYQVDCLKSDNNSSFGPIEIAPCPSKQTRIVLLLLN